ncbi:hypothetical protein B0H12DRAFT_610324 [Mycena haematopus]|nr:hypothetical protein B0H12DRAFT_610324 [Mycena haematopus]
MSPSPEFYLSAYPSFILSGLLSPPSSSPSSLHSRDSFDFAPRRGSLPTDSISHPSYASSADEGSLYYFTLQPRRDKDQYRSFLSLDLAEAQSLRSRSTRRRRSKRQSREPPFAVDFQIPDSPTLLPPPSPMRLRNSSTTSMRAMPSPKPAPLSSLPSVPSPNSSPRTQTPEVTVSRTPTPIAVQLVPQRKASVMSHATRASATTSTVSTRYRRTRRNKALACLEGRRPVVSPAPSGDFMTMTEDEDEDDEPAPAPLDRYLPSPDEDEDLLDLSLTDDQLIMLIARLDDGDLRSAPSPRRSIAHSKQSSRGSSVGTRPASQQPSSPRRRNKATLGLKSFMDFHNDEDTSRWSWRSFIEVAT